MSGPSVGNRDPERQGHRTPRDFLTAVVLRFGMITWDLAATTGHQVTGPDGCHFSPELDALTQDWRWLIDPEADDRNCRVAWLNPPFSNITPWAKKLDEECRFLRRWTLLLVPASVGANWYRDHVDGKALVLFLSGRLTFVGSTTPYPKDCMLACFGFGVSGSQIWDWRREAYT